MFTRVAADQPASFSQPDASATAPLDPRTATTGDYLVRAHQLAGGLGQIGQAGLDYGRVAANTFGLGDRIAAGISNLTGIGGGDLAAQQAETAAATKRLGPVAYAANMTGFGPVGQLGMAKGIAADLAPAGSSFLRGIFGNAVGSSAEGASANYLAALGHGASPDDAAKQGVVGAVVGAPVGALSEAAGRAFAPVGPKPPEVGQPQSSTGPATGMYAQKTAAYAPLDSLAYNTHGDAINQAQKIIRASRDPHGLGVDLGIPQDVNDIVTSLQQSPVVSGRNLQQAGSDLRATGDWTGHRFADQLDNVLQNDDPLKGGEAGDGWDAKQAGDNLYGRINDLERLAKESPSGAPGPTPSAVQQTKSRYEPDPGQPPGPEYQSLTALQNAMQPKFNFWTARHIAAPLVGAALGGAEGYFNPAEGQNHWLTAATQAAEGAAIFGGGHALARARPGSALNAANYTIGTGQPYIPPSNAGPLGDRLRAIIFGNMAGGQKPSQ